MTYKDIAPEDIIRMNQEGEMERTKGDWRGEKIVRDWLIESEDNKIIATVNGFLNNEIESDANARFIAAAPELYEVAQQIILQQEEFRDMPDDIVDGARRAIAKAEGKGE